MATRLTKRIKSQRQAKRHHFDRWVFQVDFAAFAPVPTQSQRRLKQQPTHSSIASSRPDESAKITQHVFETAARVVKTLSLFRFVIAKQHSDSTTFGGFHLRALCRREYRPQSVGLSGPLQRP